MQVFFCTNYTATLSETVLYCQTVANCCVIPLQVARQDIDTERQTYQTSSAGLDNMYSDIKKKYEEETQLRVVRAYLWMLWVYFV